jgi:DNA-binding NtrC family response regulator
MDPASLGLVGSSPALRRVAAAIEKISRYRTNVLLLGESGTGKELIARALHARGPRRNDPFVPLNCATLGREILENELFGHEKGAFTGANERKLGLFELADGGTLFLDEIAEMDPATQAKLLRVIEQNAFRRVGGSAKVKVDLSVVAATNRDLEEAVATGDFRDDLYYRLKVVTLRVPPLRERKEDIPALVDAFLHDFNRRHGEKIRGIAPQAVKLLMEHDWPGNVRELKNAVDSAAILAGGDTISAEGFADLASSRARRRGRAGDRGARGERGGGAGGGSAGGGSAGGGSAGRGEPSDGRELPGSAAPPDAAAGGSAPRAGAGAAPAEAVFTVRVGTPLVDVERDLILATLRQHPGKAEAARVLGIGVRTLYTKLALYRSRGAADLA